jgi:hypothetical protein
VDFGIGFLRRHAIARLEEQEPRPLEVCPSCASELVQPQGWRELPGGDLFLQLRCPECLVVTSGAFAQERVAEYDATLIEGRESMYAAYEAAVRHNMEELSEHFRRALELDLIGADDFELGRSRNAGPCRPRADLFAG